MRGSQIVACILLSWILKASGSHFRGAVITWAPSGNGNKINISYRVSWRSSFGSDYRCNSVGESLLGGGEMECFSNCLMSQPLTFICTDFSVQDNWSSGRNMFEYDPGTSGVIQFGFEGYAWLSLNKGGSGNWRLVATADTRVRSDTGKINSSPTVDVRPVMELQYNCYHEIQLPVSDADGDKVKCRFAKKTSTLDECESICTSFPGFIIDQDKCMLSYSATANTGLYAVAIQVEDFKSDDLLNPLSSIPVQFLVNVFNTQRECGSGPFFVPPTPENEETFDLVVGSTFNFNITAASTVSTVKQINTISPIGPQKTAPVSSNNGTASFLSIGVTWTPMSSDVGVKSYCFRAEDIEGILGDGRCVFLNVSEQEPHPCDSNPCQNGGTCNGTMESYMCYCGPNYQGTNCEIPHPCNSNPCQNGGTCNGTMESYMCYCGPNYLGTNCEIPNPCNSNPCQNGGTCNGTMEGYMCYCYPNYIGTNCETECVPKCTGLLDGDYQSCKGCRVYATCSNQLIYDYRPCPANLFWDDNSKTCEHNSTTCTDYSHSKCVDNCDGRNGGPYPACDTCDAYVYCLHGVLSKIYCLGDFKFDVNVRNCLPPDMATCLV